MPRIIDAFAFNGEFDIVEARRRELAPYVNGTAMLVTELNMHGEMKEPVIPPDFAGSSYRVLGKEAFDDCGDKQAQGFNYCALSVTKNSIALAVEDFRLSDDDWVIFSDPDEIPDREAVRLLYECEVPVGPNESFDHVRLSAHAHYQYTFSCQYYHSNWLSLDCRSNCKGPVVMRAATMRQFGFRTFQAMVKPWCTQNGPYASCGKHLKKILVPKSMWHLSSFGGVEMFSKKLTDNSDTWKPHQDLADMAHQCLDADKERRFGVNATNSKSTMKLHKKLQVEPSYPAVPHSVAEDPQRFQVFFAWDAEAN